MLASLLLAEAGFGVSPQHDRDVAVKNKTKLRRTARLTIAECAHDLLTLRCEGQDCTRNCFDKLRLMDCAAPSMSSARKQIVEQGHRGSSKFLFDKLRVMRYSINNNKYKMIYNIRGLYVCADTWFLYHGLSVHDSRVKRVLASVRAGDTEWVTTTKSDKLGRPGSTGLAAMNWMRDYILDCTDQMPTECQFLIDPVTTLDLHSTYVNYARLKEIVRFITHIHQPLVPCHFKRTHRAPLTPPCRLLCSRF